MEKQKICIVGGGLTGLVTAITLSKLNLKVDLIINNSYGKNAGSSRTIAISQSNYDFLRKLDIFKYPQKKFWPCTNMKLYTFTKKEKFIEIFAINKIQKQILYVIDNSTMIKQMIRYIKKNKLITCKTQKKVPEITTSSFLKSIKFDNQNNSKYNLIIFCTGNRSNLSKIIFDTQTFNHSYGEVSITTIVKHSYVKNNTARQIFLHNEILALLPVTNTKTSIVWSVKKNVAEKYKKKKELFLKNKIKSYVKNFIKKPKFISNIEFNDLNFFIRKKYFQDRILLFGDALHQVHPLAGQGFNMILRDLVSLEKILANRINLGLDIGSYDILSEYSDEIKPRNLIYSLGIDFIRNCFSFEKKIIIDLRNKIIKKLNKNSFAKDQFQNFADKGLKF